MTRRHHAQNYGAGGDGCEWNPALKMPSMSSDPHFNEHQATVIVGGQITYRLCASCAALPEFARMKKRVPIAPATSTEATW